jgi:hypothetical protein
MVDAFHAAALAAGGRDNGPPGIRERYHPNYYAAFVWDLDGNNIEAVCHGSGDPATSATSRARCVRFSPPPRSPPASSAGRSGRPRRLRRPPTASPSTRSPTASTAAWSPRRRRWRRPACPSFGGPWVEIGWGEARAYQAPRLTFGNILGVVFAPGPSALLIAPLRDRPDRLWGDAAVEFGVSREGLASLMADVAAEADATSRAGSWSSRRREGGQFVAARSRFRVWRMCNAWAAERLRARA